MKNEILTIEDILNSDLMNELQAQEDRDLAEAGWTYAEVRSLVKAITKK